MKGNWYAEILSKNETHGHRVKKIIAKVKTPFQTAEIIDTLDYGRCLFLDGLVQSAELDEFIYHESLIHPGLLLHPNPERIFIGGGGEGAPVREIIKHPSIKKVIMVEIDKEVVRLSRKYLSKWHEGTFDDPRVKIHYEDARKFLEKSEDAYDCIFLDLCDPGEGGPAKKLFTLQFYNLVKTRLSDDGIVVIQAGSANLNMSRGFSGVYCTLKKVFAQVLPYQACVHSFVGPWAFLLAGKRVSGDYLDQELISKRFGERRLKDKLKFYDPQVHLSIFVLPQYLRTLLKRGRVISDRKLLYLSRET